MSIYVDNIGVPINTVTHEPENSQTEQVAFREIGQYERSRPLEPGQGDCFGIPLLMAENKGPDLNEHAAEFLASHREVRLDDPSGVIFDPLVEDFKRRPLSETQKLAELRNLQCFPIDIYRFRFSRILVWLLRKN
jgi:hypothetical protein